jgi:hypothetical protein
MPPSESTNWRRCLDKGRQKELVLEAHKSGTGSRTPICCEGCEHNCIVSPPVRAAVRCGPPPIEYLLDGSPEPHYIGVELPDYVPAPRVMVWGG